MSGVALCLLSAGLLGIQIPLAKLSYMDGADPIALAMLRCIGAALPFLIWAKVRGISLKVPRDAWPGLLTIAGATTAISYGYLGALGRIPASLTALLFYLYPLIVLVISAVHARELPGIRRLGIFSLAFAGLALVFGPTLQDLDPVGVALGLLAAVGAAVYFFVVPPLTKRVSSLLLMGWSNALVGLLFIPGMLLLDGGFPQQIGGWSAFWAAATVYAIGMALTYPALARTGSVKAAMLYNFEPLTIIVLSALLLGDVMTTIQYVGGGAVLISLVLASARSAEDVLPD
jgi:drug/metabolite transporter (DMT)-like permease